MSQRPPPDVARPLYRFQVDRRWSDLIDEHTGPGCLFASPGHAFELLVGRFADEMVFLRKELAARGGPRFSEARYWRMHAHHVEAYQPVLMGPKRPGAPATVELHCFVHNDLRDWIQERKRPDGPWDKRPLPHAFDTACRVAVEAGDGPIRAAGFNFDPGALLRKYDAAGPV